MISTHTIATKNTVTFYDGEMRSLAHLDVEALGACYAVGSAGAYRSLIVNELGSVDKIHTRQLYALASLIQVKYPSVLWDWESQFFEIEKEFRYKKYKPEFYRLKGLRNLNYPRFETDYAMFDFEQELSQFLRGKESNESMLERVKVNLKVLVYKSPSHES